MSRIEELTAQIDALKAQAAPLEEERDAIWKAQQEAIAARVAACEHAEGDGFTLDELCFAAIDRCECGAGLAYPRHCGPHSSWRCSAILTRKAIAGSAHSSPRPFIFWSVISEDQKERAGNQTTRPT